MNDLVRLSALLKHLGHDEGRGPSANTCRRLFDKYPGQLGARIGGQRMFSISKVTEFLENGGDIKPSQDMKALKREVYADIRRKHRVRIRGLNARSAEQHAHV